MIKFSVAAFPKFTRNRILTVILLIGISLTAGGIALAVSSVPNPGHNISGLGGYGATGDLMYGTDGTNGGVSGLADALIGNVLISGGTGAPPSWGKVGLTTHVTGTLPTANLGSGTANSTTYLRGDQTWATPVAGVAWGAITGTLSSQTDLNTALGLKEVAANKNASNGYAGLSGVNLQIYNTGGTFISNLITSAGSPQTYTFPAVGGNVLVDSTDVTPAQGGTGLSTFGGTNTMLYTSAANTLTSVAASAAAGQFLQTTASGGTPTWLTVLGVANGGNGAAPGAADQVLVSDSTSVGTWRAIPDCSGNGKALRFTAATNTFDCNTLQFYAQSVTTPAAGFAADTYLTGSGIAIPASGMQVGTRYHMIFYVSKTAAGLVAPTINIRFGTANTVADVSRCLMTFAAQTAVVDTGTFDVWATFRTVGSGTTAIIQCVGQLRHNGTAASATAAGLGGMFVQTVTTTGGGFDSTVANSFISTSVNGGTSAAWTITLVQAELTNLN